MYRRLGGYNPRYEISPRRLTQVSSSHSKVGIVPYELLAPLTPNMPHGTHNTPNAYGEYRGNPNMPNTHSSE